MEAVTQPRVAAVKAGRCVKQVKFKRQCRGTVYEINGAGQAVCHRHSDAEVAARALKSSAIEKARLRHAMAAMEAATRGPEWVQVLAALHRVFVAANDRSRSDAQVRQVAREAGALLERLGLHR